jgi:CoA:oxalate CoA-transferase
MAEKNIKEGALQGIVILDLTRVVAGPYCTMLLADHGARVIKVEIPKTGDDTRAFGPFVNGKSVYFASVNRGKESIALNLKNPKDKKIFEQFLPQVDVIVENFRPGTMEKLGYGYDSLKEKYPTLIYAAASGFGHTGPYSLRPAYDMVVQGMGGIMSITGEPGGPPIRIGISIGDLAASLFLCVGINMALIKRMRTGLGSLVDVAMLDCQVALLENAIGRYYNTGQIPGPLGARHPSVAPFAAFKAKQSYIIIACGNNKLFDILCNAIGHPEIAANNLFQTNETRVKHVDILTATLENVLQEKHAQEWQDIITAAGVPCSMINTIDKVVNDPQVNYRHMVIETDDPVGGVMKMAGDPIKISGSDDPIKRPHSPELDEHRQKMLDDFNIKE